MLNIGLQAHFLDIRLMNQPWPGFKNISIKNEQNPIGDIEIIFTGLTEGEKLHEKLSYVEKLSPTQNKNILVAIEEEAKYPNLKEDLMFLEESIMKNDDITSLEILKKIGNYKWCILQ